MTAKYSSGSKKSVLLLSFMLSILMFSFFITDVSAEETSGLPNGCDIGQVYLEGKGCINPAFTVDQKVYPAPDGTISSSVGEIQAIRVNNPYASAGQPVIIEFTLSNIGDQLGYPFDKIDLPADVYAIQLAVDKDIGVIMADGRRDDVWGMMTGYQKVLFLLGLSNGQFWEEVTKSLQGRTCGYVEMSKYLPTNIRDKLKDMNGGKDAKVYSWECIKIVDMPYFKTAVKGYCPNAIDTACISRLNQELGNSVGDTVTVLLSSGEKSQLVRGECERPNSGTFWKDVGGYLAGNVNVVQCSMGSGGLKPGDSVTFRFVAIVPADTPVLSEQALSELDDIKKTDGALFGGYTQSASCTDSSNPKACHTIYGAVFPVAQENLIRWLGGKANQIISLLKCSGSEIWFLGKSSFKGCMAFGHSDIDVVGEPLWEGQGTFYVLGPALSATITMILWGAYVAGGLTALRKGG